MPDDPTTSSDADPAGGAPAEGANSSFAPAQRRVETSASPAHIIPLPISDWLRLSNAWAGFILAQLVVNRKAMFWPN